MPERFLQRALDLAQCGEGRTSPNPPVGAVVVSGGAIIGEGFHPRVGEPHAEIFALAAAGPAARGADLYVTLEPCSHQGRTGPCADAVIAVGIRRVFVGTVDPNPLVAGRGIARLRENGIEVISGVLEAPCRWLIAPFARHITTGLPFVTLKAAMTLDGQTATSSGASQWITGPESREHVHRLRDRCDAVLTGVGTVLSDDSRLTVRLPEGGRDPVRIVVDSTLRIPDGAQILSQSSSAPTLLVTTAAAAPDRINALRARGIEVLICRDEQGRVSLADLMERLGQRNLQHILLEAGAELNGSALRAGVVNRLAIFIAPKLFGGADGYPLFGGAGVLAPDAAWSLIDVRTRTFTDDILIEGEVSSCSPV
jgi:diaminohydroxyphosphoribosylaminopyrimidine deaminase/5-amino-6-(5-phosphoribosylamino)uracil reductase